MKSGPAPKTALPWAHFWFCSLCSLVPSMTVLGDPSKVDLAIAKGLVAPSETIVAVLRQGWLGASSLGFCCCGGIRSDPEKGRLKNLKELCGGSPILLAFPCWPLIFGNCAYSAFALHSVLYVITDKNLYCHTDGSGAAGRHNGFARSGKLPLAEVREMSDGLPPGYAIESCPCCPAKMVVLGALERSRSPVLNQGGYEVR